MARFRELDDVIHEIVAASLIGGTYLMQGDQGRAAGLFVDVLTVAREIGDLVLMIGMLPFQAISALELGRPKTAAVILGAFDLHARRYGVQPPQGLDQFIATNDRAATPRRRSTRKRSTPQHTVAKR